MTKFSTPLERVMDAQGRKQVWLAEQVGYQPRAVRAWMRGKRVPKRPVAEKVAELLGVPMREAWGDVYEVAS